MGNIDPVGVSRLPLPHHPDCVLVDPKAVKAASPSNNAFQFAAPAPPPKSQANLPSSTAIQPPKKKLPLKKQIIPTGDEIHLIPRLSKYLQAKHGAGNFRIIRVFAKDENSIEIWAPEPVTMKELHDHSRVNGPVFELRRHADGLVRVPLNCWEEKVSIWNQLVPKYWVEDWK